MTMVLALFAHLFALVEQWVFSCACVCYGLDGKLSFFTHFFSCTHLSHLFYFLTHILFILVPSKISPWKKKTRKLEIHMSFHITHIEVILWAPNSFYPTFWMSLTKLGDLTLQITLYFNPNNPQKPHTWNDLKHIVVYHLKIYTS